MSKTFQAFEFLDRQSVITFQQSFQYKSYLHFLISSENAIEYFSNHSLEEVLFLSILHHYRGIHEAETAIDIDKLSKHTKMPVAKIVETIQNWVLQGFCAFSQAPNDTVVLLNEIREDDITINRVAKNLLQYNVIKEQQFKAMTNYITNTTTCKNVLLLNYFDEAYTENCGKCSTCLQNRTQQNVEVLQNIKTELLEFPQNHQLSLIDLKEKYFDKTTYLAQALKELVEENQYLYQNATYIRL